MSRRGYLVMAILAACLAVPVIIGASCPPPSDPPFYSIIPSPTTTTQALPACEPNRVCITIKNQTCADADVILYIHNGYDLTGQYVTQYAIECCQASNATNPCPCYRPGSDTGELQLTRPELFQPQNEHVFSATGEVVLTLPGRANSLSAIGGQVTESLDCQDVKSIGVDVGMVGDLPGYPQEQSGPDYRCTMVAVDRGSAELPEDVPCGQTIQYAIVDRNECASASLTVYRVDVTTSATCTSVQTGTGGMGTGTGTGGGFGG